MKTYVVATGVVFSLVTLVHIWRMVEEGRRIATNPWYVAITIFSAAMAVWAWRVVRPSSREPR